ncbi:class I adenylate-forming enzyme family protein [Streptomyces sp. NPDC014733]|uniref:class I adenylate-forming enzyme family protein n=1 Tax=Streptomyces sp. NPDC014733 TaxID=3364885 RepID=UPI0036F61811
MYDEPTPPVHDPGPATAAPVDALLTDAARRSPDRTAVIGPAGRWSYAALDAWADAYAAALAPLLPAGEDGARGRVLVSSAPHPAFMAAYYGAIRAGAVVVPLNPMLPPAAVARVAAESGATLALLAPQVYPVLTGLRDRLPRPVRTFALWAGDDPAAEVLTDGAPRGARPARAPHDPEAVAAVMFTSGTTGPSKGVAVSHRAIRTNAAQFGDAHRIGADSAVLCHIPIVSPMHMNAAVRAGACQLLCPDPAIEESLRLADAHGATHYYSLPVRLTRLATAPEFDGVTLKTVTMVAAGNQTLAPRVIAALADRLGVPVFQGYGLTESTHLAHTDGPVGPRPGSVGPPVAGSSSRIVDLTTGRPLPAGATGELQIRGPQLMSGYTNRPDLRPFDADGWFATGDVGRLDADGYLYVLDRTADVFHRDGELIAPSLLERALEAHPDVREAAVVERPDGDRGHAPVAFLATAHDLSDDRLAALVADVNAALRPHERLAGAVAVAAVPRSRTNGKVDRKALRAELPAARVVAV